jgi:hypothetical protein
MFVWVGNVVQPTTTKQLNSALAVRISISFEDCLHFSNVTLASRLLDEKLKHFGLKAQVNGFTVGGLN